MNAPLAILRWLLLGLLWLGCAAVPARPAHPIPPAAAYLYTGEQIDSDLGMYYLRARYYQPATGRFWTMDSFEGRQGESLSLHKYLYCHGNPFNGADPSGHEFSMIGISSTMAVMSFANNIELQGSHAILAKAEFLFGADDSTHSLITGLEFAMIGNDVVGNVSLGVAGAYGAFKTIGLLRSMSGYALRGAVSGWNSLQKRINAAKLGDLAAKAEVRCIKFLEGLGINVHVKDPVPGAPSGPLTADIIVGGQPGSGAGGITADIFSPESATVQGVVDGIVAKARQVQGGVVVVDLSRTPVTADQLGDIMARVAARNEADRIKDVIIVPK